MPLFNVYCGSGQTFSLECRKIANQASQALMDSMEPNEWTAEIVNPKGGAGPGEIVRDKSGREWFAVAVNSLGPTV
jgi:hypothetical protein